MDAEQRKLERCRYMRRWRKRICIAFLPVGFILMAGLQSAVAGSLLLAWPLLLLYTLGVMIALQQLDTCPWGRQSFHASNRSSGARVGLSMLWRDRCANCGKPDPAVQPEGPA
ncbi:MAG: hypothetical protein V2J12_08455 [Gammaproteobacteria bacterium]|jgi:hypothetical protein|nr:hypothetical protein [Gammaproteobacteria bacterium]